jgi:Tfp pilus assembly protein PilP
VLCVAATSIAVLAFAGCGESKEEKAEKTICSSRSSINTEIEHLRSIKLSTEAPSEVKNAATAIAEDTKKIVEASKELSPEAQANVQKAVEAFNKQLAEAVGKLISGGALGASSSQLTSSLEAVATAYKQDLASIKC